MATIFFFIFFISYHFNAMGHGYLKKAHTGNGVLWALTDGHDFNHFDSFLCIFPFFFHLTYSLWFVLP